MYPLSMDPQQLDPKTGEIKEVMGSKPARATFKNDYQRESQSSASPDHYIR